MIGYIEQFTLNQQLRKMILIRDAAVMRIHS